jgi:hypothetical protein
VGIGAVHNDRPGPGHWSADLVGYERSSHGITYEVNLRGARGPSMRQAVRRILAQALAVAGLEPVPAITPGLDAVAEVTIRAFWCDGHLGDYEAHVGLSIALRGPAKGPRRATVHLDRRSVGSDCRHAFFRTLTGVFADAVDAFEVDSTRAAALAAPPGRPRPVEEEPAAPATVAAITSPPGATLAVDEEVVGKAPLLLKVKPGARSIRATWPDGVSVVVEEVLDAGRPRTVRLFRPAP